MADRRHHELRRNQGSGYAPGQAVQRRARQDADDEAGKQQHIAKALDSAPALCGRDLAGGEKEPEGHHGDHGQERQQKRHARRPVLRAQGVWGPCTSIEE